MAYCTADDLRSLTGTDREASSLTAIIAQADREINLYLTSRGIAPPAADDDLKTVSIMLSKVGLQELGQPDGSFEASQGDFYTSSPTRDVAYMRKIAYDLLDQYVVHQTVADGVRTRVSRIRSGCR